MSEILRLTLKREYFAQIGKKNKSTQSIERKSHPSWTYIENQTVVGGATVCDAVYMQQQRTQGRAVDHATVAREVPTGS
jgi:hypothetical protein